MLCTSAPIRAEAQLVGTVSSEQTEPTPAHLSYIEGEVSLEREGQTDAATANVPLIPGDRLRTSEGRAEILFPDGSVLRVDVFSTLDIQSETLLRLTMGRVLLTVRGADSPADTLRYQVDTPAGSAATDGRGDYRIGVVSGSAGVQTELAVLRGVGTLATERGATMVRAGRRSLAAETFGPTEPEVFNSARFDDFDRWADARRTEQAGRTSAQYLPQELDAYSGTFDRYGQWQREPTYGYVWYPTVAADWRPYYRGYWSPFRRYGWTWVGHDVWAWPTHHYGRWGYHGARWFWIPGRHWSPAWVHWASAPGYVSWCPLGFDNRPVFSLSVSVGSPWRGWVVVPRAHFGSHRYYVPRHSIPPHRFGSATPFVVQARAPVAVPRSSRFVMASDERVGNRSGVGGSPRTVPNRRAITRDGAAPWSGPPPTSAAGGTSVPSPTAPRFTQPLPRAFRRTPEAAEPQTSTSTVPERPLERRRSIVPTRPVPPAPSASVVPNRGPDEVTRYRSGEGSQRRAPSAMRRDALGAARPPEPQHQNRDPGLSPRERSRGEPRAVRPAVAPSQGSTRGGGSSGAGARRREGGAERGSADNGRSSGGARRRSP